MSWLNGSCAFAVVVIYPGTLVCESKMCGRESKSAEIYINVCMKRHPLDWKRCLLNGKRCHFSENEQDRRSRDTHLQKRFPKGSFSPNEQRFFARWSSSCAFFRERLSVLHNEELDRKKCLLDEQEEAETPTFRKDAQKDPKGSFSKWAAFFLPDERTSKELDIWNAKCAPRLHCESDFSRFCCERPRKLVGSC